MALIMVLGGVVFSVVRRRRVTITAGPAEWPPFEPRLVPSPDPAPPTDPTPSAEVIEWIVPGPDGAIPASHPVKVKVSSGIFHVPGGRFYERTTADRLYPNAQSAEAAGYRPSKS
jgi:hypothetical protein